MLADDPKGRVNDDYCYIIVRRNVARLEIPSLQMFRRSLRGGEPPQRALFGPGQCVEVRYYPQPGKWKPNAPKNENLLDGRVSYVRISR